MVPQVNGRSLLASGAVSRPGRSGFETLSGLAEVVGTAYLFRVYGAQRSGWQVPGNEVTARANP
jgi:hypothetical protein